MESKYLVHLPFTFFNHIEVNIPIFSSLYPNSVMSTLLSPKLPPNRIDILPSALIISMMMPFALSKSSPYPIPKTLSNLLVSSSKVRNVNLYFHLVNKWFCYSLKYCIDYGYRMYNTHLTISSTKSPALNGLSVRISIPPAKLARDYPVMAKPMVIDLKHQILRYPVVSTRSFQ